MKKNKKTLWLGNLFILAGLLLLLLIFRPVLIQEANYRFKKNSLPESIETITPVSRDFSLIIPKIGINSPVFPKIDSNNEQEYGAVLKKGVAHAKGSSLPDEPGVVFIFGHSTDAFYNLQRDNAVFYSLGKLEKDDPVFIFYQDEKYSYQVTAKEVVSSEAVEERVKKLQGNYLVLQTCYPPGTTLKRLIVTAKPV